MTDRASFVVLLRKPLAKQFWLVFLAIFLIGACGSVRFALQLDQPAHDLIMIGFLATGLALGAYFAPRKSTPIRLRPPLLLIPAVLIAFWIYLVSTMGFFAIEPFLFHLRTVGQSTGEFVDFFRITLPALVMPALFLLGLWGLYATDPRLSRLDAYLAVPLVLLNPIVLESFSYVSDSWAGTDSVLANRYETFGRSDGQSKSPPSVLHIFLESTEASFLDETRFGNTMEPLRPYIDDGLLLSNVEQVAQTGWTIAGQIASSCGVPLMTIGLRSYGAIDYTTDGLLPNARCLQTIFSESGYETAYFTIADIKFQNTKVFTDTHPFDLIVDYSVAGSNYPDGDNPFGMDDEDIFAEAEKFLDNRAANQPFYMHLVTISGHSPSGFVSRSCKRRRSIENIDDPTLRAFRCTNELVAEFIENLRAKGSLENTIVILQSDHLAMRNTVTSLLDQSERSNLFVAYGPGIEPAVIDKPLSTLDFFPTILELSGLPTESRKAGLGVSAFSDEPSLVEEFGTSQLNRMIRRDRPLRSKLWGLPEG